MGNMEKYSAVNGRKLYNIKHEVSADELDFDFGKLQVINLLDEYNDTQNCDVQHGHWRRT